MEQRPMDRKAGCEGRGNAQGCLGRAGGSPGSPERRAGGRAGIQNTHLPSQVRWGEARAWARWGWGGF